MNWWILLALTALSITLLLMERVGIKTTLKLSFKGDIKRESAFLAQYGQGACTAVVILLVLALDRRQHLAPMYIAIAVIGTSLVAYGIKRLTGRSRPNRQDAGQFLGPSARHANWRESFPSSHSAAAIALSVVLCHYYPQAASVFWSLGILTAVLRYLVDAHWPSDVMAGVALGYAIGHASINLPLA